MKKRLVSFSLVMAVILSTVLTPIHTYAADRLKDIREERKEIKQELSQAEAAALDMAEEMKALKDELFVLEESLEENKKAMREVKEEIDGLEGEIDALQKKIDERFEILDERARSYQETGGNISFLEVIFGAKDFTDLISRLNAVSQITDSDAAIIKQQAEEQEKVEEKLAEQEDLEAELKEMDELIREQKETAEKMKKSLSKKEKKLKKKMKALKKKDSRLATKEADLLYESDEKIISTSNKQAMLAWPTKGGYISSTFGKRWGRQHQGIDIARTDRSTKPPIAAAEAGTVEQAGDRNNGYGKMVVINHGNGMKTLYAHMDSLSVKPGQKVERGQKIGVMGATGRSTGVHLHFEVHENGSPKNPVPYLK